MDLREVDYDDVNWIYLVENNYWRLALLKYSMNLLGL
jgi:hypothetical protein